MVFLFLCKLHIKLEIYILRSKSVATRYGAICMKTWLFRQESPDCLPEGHVFYNGADSLMVNNVQIRNILVKGLDGVV